MEGKSNDNSSSVEIDTILFRNLTLNEHCNTCKRPLTYEERMTLHICTDLHIMLQYLLMSDLLFFKKISSFLEDYLRSQEHVSYCNTLCDGCRKYCSNCHHHYCDKTCWSFHETCGSICGLMKQWSSQSGVFSMKKTGDQKEPVFDLLLVRDPSKNTEAWSGRCVSCLQHTSEIVIKDLELCTFCWRFSHTDCDRRCQWPEVWRQYRHKIKNSMIYALDSQFTDSFLDRFTCNVYTTFTACADCSVTFCEFVYCPKCTSVLCKKCFLIHEENYLPCKIIQNWKNNGKVVKIEVE